MEAGCNEFDEFHVSCEPVLHGLAVVLMKLWTVIEQKLALLQHGIALHRTWIVVHAEAFGEALFAYNFKILYFENFKFNKFKKVSPFRQYNRVPSGARLPLAYDRVANHGLNWSRPVFSPPQARLSPPERQIIRLVFD